MRNFMYRNLYPCRVYQKATVITMLFLFFLAGNMHAQQLELGSASSSTSATGPLPTSANANTASPVGSATFLQNTGTSATFSAYTPATTYTVSFSNQQYTGSAYPGLAIGGNAVSNNTTTLSASNIFVPFNNIASPLATMFTSAPNIATAGTNMSITTNYAYRMSTDAFYLVGQSAAARKYNGDVFNDLNGLADNTVNGSGTNGGGLFANLVDANGNVYAVATVAAGGTYTFSNIVTSNYTIILTTTAGTVGSPLSTATLPANWSSTGETQARLLATTEQRTAKILVA